MIAAAATASSTTSGPTSLRASAVTATWSRTLRDATADATATPQRCSGVRLPGASTACRFSLMSRAGSTISPARTSTADTLGRLGGVQRRVALLPVARAELVRLEGVQNAQHLIDVSPDVEVGD